MALPQLLFDNAAGYAAEVARHQARAVAAQPVVTAFNALGAPGALTTADLPRLLSDPRGLLLDKLLNGEPLTLGGVPVSRARALELVSWPGGTDAYLAAVETARRSADGGDLSGCVLTAGVVSFDATTVNRDSYRFYATTQKQLDYWNALQAVATALTGLRDAYYGGASLSLKTALIDRFLVFTEGQAGAAAQPGTVRVNHQEITRL